MPSSIIIAINNLKHNYMRKRKVLGKLCSVFCIKKKSSHFSKYSGLSKCSERAAIFCWSLIWVPAVFSFSSWPSALDLGSRMMRHMVIICLLPEGHQSGGLCLAERLILGIQVCVSPLCIGVTKIPSNYLEEKFILVHKFRGAVHGWSSPLLWA